MRIKMPYCFTSLRSVQSLAIYLVVIAAFLTGCKKLVTVNPPDTELTSDNIYSDNATAASVLTGVYTLLSGNSLPNGQGVNSISLVCGLSADEFSLFAGSANLNALLTQFYFYSLTPGLATGSNTNMWSTIYSYLYTINLALERLSTSNSLTNTVRSQLMGEAKFLRAFCYFYLVNLYGPVPVVTGSDYSANIVLARSPEASVYQLIISDLRDAQHLLTNGYVASDAITSTSERVRPNLWVATALLARVYLYTDAYDSAASEATAIINNSGMYSLCADISKVFIKNSTEAIWQLQPVNAGWNTEDARAFILPSTGPTNTSGMGHPVYLTPDLVNSFEGGDLRRSVWVDSVIANGSLYYYPLKYKSATLGAPVTEYEMVFRLAEQYLIRAEAEANGAGDGVTGAIQDLNRVRRRASLPAYSGAQDKASVLSSIIKERRVEFFTEWGHRWLDLKRTGTVNNIMQVAASQKPASWSPNWLYYPIPLYDIVRDPKLTQNPGY